jgi:hypothetical protein
MQAAKELGWTHIAVTYSELTEIESAGYGLVDNKSSELSKWNFKVVARLDRLLGEASHPMLGWTQDMLDVLRAADWKSPEIIEGDAHEAAETMSVKFGEHGWELTKQVVDRINQTLALAGREPVKESEALEIVLRLWLESSSGGTE